MQASDMTDAAAELLTDDALLVAVAEQLAKSMNGPRAQRLAIALDTLGLEPTGSLLPDDDAAWLESGIAAARTSGQLDRWRTELTRLAADGVAVIACTSPEYPTNLQLVHDRPPLIFVRGDIAAEDQRAVAIVGTREASEAGTRTAATLAADLTEAGVTLLSGLAKGIDTAAHAAAVNRGRRTIAVFGTPIDRIYPAENRKLAAAIIDTGGTHISQFLPGTDTGRWGFPVRNVTMSGLAVGTIVIEAGETSGARLLAEAALAHGKRVFLLEHLATHRRWARHMSEQPNVTVTSDAASIVAHIDRLLDLPHDISPCPRPASSSNRSERSSSASPQPNRASAPSVERP